MYPDGQLTEGLVLQPLDATSDTARAAVLVEEDAIVLRTHSASAMAPPWWTPLKARHVVPHEMYVPSQAAPRWHLHAVRVQPLPHVAEDSASSWDALLLPRTYLNSFCGTVKCTDGWLVPPLHFLPYGHLTHDLLLR